VNRHVLLAALALVAVDNPMCPGTGHRICNDCMKACIFQKQEPVNIPQVESGVLTDVLRLPWGVELCRRLGMDGDLIGTNASPSGVHVLCHGRLERLPDGLAIMAPRRLWPMVTTPILSWPGKLRLAADWLIPRRRTPQDESLASFVRRRLGQETLERLVQPLAGGIYMGDPEQLSIQATLPQFVEMERKHGSLIRAARRGQTDNHASREPGGPQYSMFVAPRRGMAQLVQALVDRLAGCHIHCGQQIERVLPGASGGWCVDAVHDGTGARRQVRCAGVILAVPTWQAGALLEPVHQELAGLLARTPYAGCVAVNLAYDRSAVSHPLDSFGFVVPHVEGRSVLACTFSSAKYQHRAPEGKVLFRTFLGGACFPDVHDWPDERVLKTVQDELGQVLGIAGPPLFSRISRWPMTMPQYQVGHLQQVERMEKMATSLPGLELAGNGYRGVGIPQCIRSGEQASERLVATLRRTMS